MDYISEKQMLALVKLSLDYNTQVTGIAIQVLNSKHGIKHKELQKTLQQYSADYNKRIEQIMAEGDQSS